MFKVGDVVSLKSGGNWMTVEGTSEEGVDCVWMSDSGLLHERTFDEEMLTAEEIGEEEEEEEEE